MRYLYKVKRIYLCIKEKIYVKLVLKMNILNIYQLDPFRSVNHVKEEEYAQKNAGLIMINAILVKRNYFLMSFLYCLIANNVMALDSQDSLYQNLNRHFMDTP